MFVFNCLCFFRLECIPFLWEQSCFREFAVAMLFLSVLLLQCGEFGVVQSWFRSMLHSNMHEHSLRTVWMHSKCRFLFILFVIWMYCVGGGCTPAHCVDMIWFGILCMRLRDHDCNVFFECCVIVCCLFVKVCLFVRAVFSPNTFFSLRPPPCRRPTSSRPGELVAASSASLSFARTISLSTVQTTKAARWPSSLMRCTQISFVMRKLKEVVSGADGTNAFWRSCE